jgi:hypothetical protein
MRTNCRTCGREIYNCRCEFGARPGRIAMLALVVLLFSACAESHTDPGSTYTGHVFRTIADQTVIETDAAATFRATGAWAGTLTIDGCTVGLEYRRTSFGHDWYLPEPDVCETGDVLAVRAQDGPTGLYVNVRRPGEHLTFSGISR